PWRLIPGRDYEPTKFLGMARCHPWEAMQHAAGNAFSSPIPPAKPGSPMNSGFLIGLLEELVDIEPSIKWHFQLPQGWFRNIGDFAIGGNFGGEEGFRRLAAFFRDGGHLLTVHVRLAHFNNRSEVGREHPEWKARIRPCRKKPYFWSANEKEEGVTELMDVTREEVRNHLKWQIRRFLSSEPGCLDMDGIQPTGDNWPSALDYELANDKYGVGDLLAYKINKELLLYGKSIKPWAMVQGQGIEGINNPLYGLSQEMSTTEDHLSVPIHTIQQLRLLTNCLPMTQLHIANYCTTRTKALSVWPLSVAVGRPEIDNPRAFTSVALDDNWIPIDQAYRRRMAAVLAAYANSPWTLDTINVPVRVEGHGLRMDVYAGRKRTQGKMAGFYSALSLGSNTVVTYSERRIVAVSMVSRTVIIPLPPRVHVVKVAQILHSGEAREHAFFRKTDGIECHIPDAAGEIKYIEVQYLIDNGINKEII
ncbi:MAG: hypothetical protein KAQ69_13190, partial [Spirochaetales bacterium]|nr:hypothetical protein [Spirochaetales bacterium]